MTSSESPEAESHSNGPTFSLENILGNDHDKLEHPDIRPEGWDEEDVEREVAHGYCVECEGAWYYSFPVVSTLSWAFQTNQLKCAVKHAQMITAKYVSQHSIEKAAGRSILQHPWQMVTKVRANQSRMGRFMKNQTGTMCVLFVLYKGFSDFRVWLQVEMEDGEGEDALEAVPPHEPISDLVLSSQPALGSDPGEWFVERTKYIPLRLTLAERKYLRLLEAALQVSEYTDKIDTLGFGLSKAKRIVHQIRELCAILSGLVLAADYKQGQELFTDRDFASNSDFYQKVFELGRRHKIMNPDKMRTTYGKLIYLLQVRPPPRHV